MLVILTGFTASGKDTHQQAIINQKDNNLSKLITYTTRAPRHNEINGVHYHFINDSEFDILAAKNLLIGIREYSNGEVSYRYGINKNDFNLNENKTIILDPSGTIEIINTVPRDNVIVVYLESNEDDLLDRAVKRGDHIDDFKERVRQDKIEFLPLYPHIDLRINTSGNLKNIENNIKIIKDYLEEKKWTV